MQQNNIKKNAFNLILLFSAGLILLFIIAPLINLFLQSKAPELFLTIKDKEIQNSIALTLWTSMAGTLILSIFAIPFAYLLARKEFIGKKIIMSIIDIPIVIQRSSISL